MATLRSQSIDRLFEVILQLESVEECYRFFEDICTVHEVQDMAQRLEVAELLRARKNYQEISATTAVSSATISRVNRCLRYGHGGYRMALEKNDAEEKK